MDKLAYGEMPDTANERHAKQSYNEVPPHTGQNGHDSRNLQITNVGEGAERREPPTLLVGM